MENLTFRRESLFHSQCEEEVLHKRVPESPPCRRHSGLRHDDPDAWRDIRRHYPSRAFDGCRRPAQHLAALARVAPSDEGDVCGHVFRLYSYGDLYCCGAGTLFALATTLLLVRGPGIIRC